MHEFPTTAALEALGCGATSFELRHGLDLINTITDSNQIQALMATTSKETTPVPVE